jgi:hypothetical protein
MLYPPLRGLVSRVSYVLTNMFRNSVAYAFSDKPDDVYSITDWPGAQGRSVPKAPTVIRYENRGKTFKWGYELSRSTEEKIEGIKLLLDPDQRRPLFDSTSAATTEAELTKLAKPPVSVASDYIGAIYQHALKVISGKYPKDYLDMLDKQFVLSVPAVWSDKAKDLTMKVGCRHVNLMG